MQYQRMVVVQAAPCRLDYFRSRVLGRRNLTRGWRPAELNE